MSSTTSRLNLVQVAGSDQPSQIRVAIDTNAGILDNAVTFSQGTNSNRPSAAIAGRQYYATDSAQFFTDTGTAWIPQGLAVVSASGSTSASPGQFILCSGGTPPYTVMLPSPTQVGRTMTFGAPLA